MYADLDNERPESVIGFADGLMVADLKTYRRSKIAEGRCPLIWRQGVKHDAASVMELKKEETGYTNKLGGNLDVETQFIYPLLKTSDLCQEGPPTPRWSVIVTQESVGQRTESLQERAPKLWKYLKAHEHYFDKRKSSIYTKQPPFSIFGIGSYSFSPYKVAVAGLTKSPRFWPLSPIEGRPIMLDDTCYFLPCQTEQQALILSAILNEPLALDLLKSLTFTDSKRPITKKLLQRIDVLNLLRCSSTEEHFSAVERLLTPLIELGTKKFSYWPQDAAEKGVAPIWSQLSLFHQ